MKKTIVATLFLLVLSVFAAKISYSAFPVISQQTAAPAVSEQQATVSVHESAAAVTTAKSASSTPAKKPMAGDDQVIALILVLLAGGLGIHRFYLGYTWQGIVQLLTAGGCGIWALIDLIRIITGDLQPKDGSYSRTL